DDRARTGARHDHRLAAQLGPAQQLDRDVERVHVQMRDRRHGPERYATDPTARRTRVRGRPAPARAAQCATWTVPVEPNPSLAFVAAVRSNSRPATNGPRSITRVRTTWPRWRSV